MTEKLWVINAVSRATNYPTKRLDCTAKRLDCLAKRLDCIANKVIDSRKNSEVDGAQYAKIINELK